MQQKTDLIEIMEEMFELLNKTIPIIKKNKPNLYEQCLLKNMNIDEMANFLRDDILYHLPCQGVCEAQEECPFACLKMVKEWLNSEV